MPAKDLAAIAAPTAKTTEPRTRAKPKPKKWEDRHTRRKIWINDEQDTAVAKATGGEHRATTIRRLFDLLLAAGSIEAIEEALDAATDVE